MKILFFLAGLIFIPAFLWAQDAKPTAAQQKVLDSAHVSVQDVDVAMKQTLTESADKSADALSNEKIVQSKSVFGLDIPPVLKNVADVLDKAGDSSDIKETEDAINDAGSAIVSALKPIMDNAINSIDFGNVLDILAGGQNAATAYLEDNYGDQISAALAPIVQKELTGTGALDHWQAVVSKYEDLTGKKVNFNLVNYVSQEVIGNMFDKMGKEESKIRLNAYLWSTAAMKAVLALQHKMPR